MKTILYIVPYFGKLPKLFPLWLQSCKYNSTINWLIFTDDETDYAYPSNVSVIYTTFDNVRTRIQRLYDFKITLESPYKLCDFKVAYGEVFADFINGYDFWGYCDVDLLFGNIRSFLTDKILESYDKIGWLGHSTLFKNCHQMNTLYRKELGGVRLYCIFFQSNKNHFFDEKWINLICKEQNISVFREVVFADLTPLTWNFQINHVTGEELLKNRHRLFVWNNGELSRVC